MRINYIIPDLSFGAQRTVTNAKTNYKRDSLTTAGAWFGFGVGLDLLSRKCRFSKSPFKNSLAINSILAASAGGYTWWRGKHNTSVE